LNFFKVVLKLRISFRSREEKQGQATGEWGNCDATRRSELCRSLIKPLDDLQILDGQLDRTFEPYHAGVVPMV
jgi:hypothetical protein